MTKLEIIELCIVGIFCLIHIVSNFYNGKCTCKLCALAKTVLALPQNTKNSEEVDNVKTDLPSIDKEADRLIKELMEYLTKNGT